MKNNVAKSKTRKYIPAMKTKRVKTTVVHIPNDLHKHLKNIAIETGMKIEAIAREAITSYLATYKR